MAAPALCVTDLTVRFGDRVALAGVDFDLEAGASLGVIGPNGSGKSSLLHAVAGLVPPAAGSIECDRRSTALVLQSTAVDRSLPITVLETVRMGRYPHRGPLRRFRRRDHEAVEAAMERMAVADLATRQFHDLSGGQRQRVLVAQGLAQEADLLLLDEPVTGLDLVTRDAILDVVDEEVGAGRSVVMTTHSLDDARRCNWVLLLVNRVVAFGPPEQVITDEHLRAAFGDQVVRLGAGQVLVDDPHHAH